MTSSSIEEWKFNESLLSNISNDSSNFHIAHGTELDICFQVKISLFEIINTYEYNSDNVINNTKKNINILENVSENKYKKHNILELLFMHRTKQRFIPYKTNIVNNNNNQFVHDKYGLIQIKLEECEYTPDEYLHVHYILQFQEFYSPDSITLSDIENILYDSFHELYSNTNYTICLDNVFLLPLSYFEKNNVYIEQTICLEIKDIPHNIRYHIL